MRRTYKDIYQMPWNERVLALTKEQDLSLKQVAVRIDVPLDTMYGWRRDGSNTCSMDVRKKIAKELRLPAGWKFLVTCIEDDLSATPLHQKLGLSDTPTPLLHKLFFEIRRNRSVSHRFRTDCATAGGLWPLLRTTGRAWALYLVNPRSSSNYAAALALADDLGPVHAQLVKKLKVWADGLGMLGWVMSAGVVGLSLAARLADVLEQQLLLAAGAGVLVVPLLLVLWALWELDSLWDIVFGRQGEPAAG